MTTIVRIPFEGFYESFSDQIIEDEIEAEVNDNGMDYNDVEFNHYKGAHKQFSKDYVKGFENILLNEFDINVDLVFKELASPREYNFETDKIIVEISDKQLENLYSKVMGDPELLEQARETASKVYDSSSGFLSFYPTFSKDFENIPFEEWNEAQKYLIFATLGDKFEAEQGDLVQYMNSESAFEESKDYVRAKTESAIKKAQKKQTNKPE